MRWSLWFTVVVSSCATPALAAVVTVAPNGPLATIQSGVDAAAAGDVVVVKAGLYSGNVVVPAGKDGLVLKASGKVVLDARGAAGAAIGAGIVLNSAGVVVRGFVIRNAATAAANLGDGIRANKDGCRIERCTVTACEKSGVVANASNVVVKSSKLSQNDFGFEAGPNLTGIVVTKTDFEFNEDRAANLKADTTARFEKCRVRGGLNGIRGSTTTANNATQILKCTFDGVIANAVLLTATDAVVAHCVVKRGGGGMFLQGANGDIHDNRIDGAASNSSALFIKKATGFVLADNVLVSSGGTALDLDDSSSNCTLIDNVVKQSVASNSRSAYIIAGPGHVLEGNRAIDVSGDGFGVVGSNAVLTKCVALRCGRDGFDVDPAANGTKLNDCAARQCRAEGLENSGAATVVDGGVFLQNRIDVANDGTITLNGATFVTGGQNVAPQID